MRAVAFLAILEWAETHQNHTPRKPAADAVIAMFFFVFLALDIWSISHGGW